MFCPISFELQKMKKSTQHKYHCYFIAVMNFLLSKVSKDTITFNNAVCTFDDQVEENIEIKNIGTQKLKWVLNFDSYNQPVLLSFEPPFGSIPKVNKSNSGRLTSCRTSRRQ